MTVRTPGNEETQDAAAYDVEWMVTGVHNTADGDKGCDEKRNENQERLPYLAAGVEDVELPGQKEREETEASEGDCAVLGGKRERGSAKSCKKLTASVTRRETLEAIIQDA